MTRLALAVARRYGLQSSEHGGDDAIRGILEMEGYDYACLAAVGSDPGTFFQAELPSAFYRSQRQRSPSRIWSTSDIRAEWQAELARETDVETWALGMEAYAETLPVPDADRSTEDVPADESTLSRAREQMSIALRHHLHGEPLLWRALGSGTARALAYTVEEVSIATANIVISRSEEAEEVVPMSETDKKWIRLALGTARAHGLQPESMGGDGSLATLFANEQMTIACRVALGQDPADFFSAETPSLKLPPPPNLEDPVWQQTYADRPSDIGEFVSRGDVDRHEQRLTQANYMKLVLPLTLVRDPRRLGRTLKDLVTCLACQISSGELPLMFLFTSMEVPWTATSLGNSELDGGLEEKMGAATQFEKLMAGLLTSHPLINPEREDTFLRLAYNFACDPWGAASTIGFFATANARTGAWSACLGDPDHEEHYR